MSQQEFAMVNEETLDPMDWQSLRTLGHRMLDDMLDYLENARQRPVWRPIPEQVRSHFKEPVPQEPQELEQVYREFLDTILPYQMGTTHPRFWGWVIGTGTPTGMLADMLASGLNPNLGGGNHIANDVEAQVVQWCKEMLGYSQQASGVLVSGGSMANLIGLAIARNTKAGFDIRREGLQACRQKMTVYGSSEMHSSIQKAVELLGLGSTAMREIPVNSEYQVDISALQEAISQDRAAGYQPFCVVGCAGTVNTGAFDDLNQLADLCAREDLWFHVDGAFGALAALAPGLKGLVSGMERADSLAFDLHKWMYLPFDVGCVLVRRKEDHLRTFSLTPEYLAHGDDRGLAGGSIWFSDYSIELTRRFRGLKVWMSLKEHGLRKYGRMIEQNVEQARYLEKRILSESELELLAPVSLNIVCFRYKVPGLDDPGLNRLNQELLTRLHESGVAVPSYTTLNGRYALRAAIVNQRSRREDFDVMVNEVLSIGRQLAEEI